MKYLLLSLPILLIIALEACVHEPVLPQDVDPGDTLTNPPGDSIPGDTLIPGDSIFPNPCDPDTIYFVQDLLPILVSNCAKSGCHDANTAQNGVVLNSYVQVMATADVRPGDAEKSDLYEVLVEDDPDKKMPPSPNTPLRPEQIEMVRTWIEQGAQDLSCSDSAIVACDTTSVSFSATVDPILTVHCKGCHNANGSSGGVNLSTYAGVATVANSGKLYGAIAHLPGFSKMPQGGAQLPDCEIRQIKSWIDAGALDN